MRMTVFARMVVLPLSVVLLAIAGLAAPPEALRSVLGLVAIGALGFMVLALASRAFRSRRILALARMNHTAQVAKVEASALSRMESDAG